MSHDPFLPHTCDDCLAHAIEECGEFIAAAGKTLRFGYLSVNPLLPAADREPNIEWLRRELADVRQAMARLEAQLDRAFGS